MSINVKKYTKDQMAKMVEDSQAEVQELKRVNAALAEQISQMNGEAITRENVIANLKAHFDSAKTSAQCLNDQGQQYWRAWQASKREVADLKNKLNATEAVLEWANAELTHSVDEKNALRNDVTKMTDKAALECGRANYAEAHPWRNLWAWVKRKLKMA